MTTMTYRHDSAVASGTHAVAATPVALTGASAPHLAATSSVAPAKGRLGALIVIGVIGGILSGLFAIGGGILMVPLLAWRARMDQRRAAATSLVAIIPTAVVSSVAYLIHGDIDVVAGAFVAVGAVAGAVLGSRLLKRLPVTWLRWAFIVFILTIAVRLLLVTPGRGHSIPLTPWVVLGYLALGMVMGLASGLFGIGGGIIAVPLLVSIFAVGDLVAKGTALVVSIPTSVVATTSNHRHGLLQTADIRAGLIVGTAAALASVPAVDLAVAIPAKASGVLFALLLVAVATQLAVKAVRGSRAARSAG
jgi:uncharacterized membrane protein YfcA